MAEPAPRPDESLSGQLQRLVQSIKAAGRASLPRSNDALLLSIVEAAASIFGAAAASILLLDEREGTLVFRVSTGAADHDLVGTSFPMGQGIAGYVAMTGQPIAVSDVQRDPRFAAGFARSTGYVPRSILATPLISGERVIGVMEVLDKINAVSFGIQDMELLGMFAHQAAIAIEGSQRMECIVEALEMGLQRVAAQAEDDGGEAPDLGLNAILGVLHAGEEALNAGDLLALADLFNDVAGLGPAERQAAIQILTTFANYSRSRTRWRR